MGDRCDLCRKGRFMFLFLALSVIAVPSGSWARLGADYQMALGNPDGASTNTSSRTKFLINQRAQYAISYNDDTHQPNWVSWSYSLDDDGTQPRTDYWQTEELLPTGYLKIDTASFGSSNINGTTISWNRGHMCPSADRTKDLTNNRVTFRMSNIIPQADANNQGLWAQFEDYCRTLAAEGSEVLILCGPSEFTGSRIGNQMAIPGSVWKIAVVIPNSTSTTPANQRINTSCRVLAILTPNVSTGLEGWQSYLTSVEEIEAVTGFNFFSSVNSSVATYLKNVVDTGTGPNEPIVITGFSPASGPAGTTVAISGYNFGSSSVVKFNGVTATASVQNGGTQINATVPASATTGTITVMSTSNGTDRSAQAFTVSSSLNPILTLSASSLSGFTSVSGTASASQSYTVNGSNLTSNVVVTAPTGYEVSLDNGTFGGSKTLVPRNGSLSEVTVYVRLSVSATTGGVIGTVINAGGGATTQNLSLEGSVQTSRIYWDFQTANPTSGIPNGLTVSEISQGNNNGVTALLTTTSASKNEYQGASKLNNAEVAARTGTLVTETSAYFEFKITPETGTYFTITGLSFGARSTSTGPQAYTLRSSSDSYTSDIVTGVLSNNSIWVLKSHMDLKLFHSSVTTFRLYGHSGSGLPTTSQANWRIDDLSLEVATSQAPVITLNGPDVVNLYAGSSYTELGATATDAATSVGITGSVNTSILGSYTLTYSASDGNGIVGITTRTVNVVLNPSNSGSADSDGNGMSDLLEYALGGSPTGNSLAILPSVALVGDNLQTTFQARTNDPSLTIQPFANSSLSPTGWSSSAVTKISAVPVSGKEGFETQIWATPVTGTDRKFLKVNITR